MRSQRRKRIWDTLVDRWNDGRHKPGIAALARELGEPRSAIQKLWTEYFTPHLQLAATEDPSRVPGVKPPPAAAPPKLPPARRAKDITQLRALALAGAAHWVDLTRRQAAGIKADLKAGMTMAQALARAGDPLTLHAKRSMDAFAQIDLAERQHRENTVPTIVVEQLEATAAPAPNDLPAPEPAGQVPALGAPALRAVADDGS